MKQILVLAVLGLAAKVVTGGAFELTRHSIDGGGVIHSTGGGFELSATIGQPDAGVLTGGDFELSGGFWFEVPAGDCDEDGLVNLGDHDYFTQCFSGPNVSVLTGCECFDVDGSGSIDLHDFAVTSRALPVR